MAAGNHKREDIAIENTHLRCTIISHRLHRQIQQPRQHSSKHHRQPTQPVANVTARLQADHAVAPQSQQAPLRKASKAEKPMPKEASPLSTRPTAQELCKPTTQAPQSLQRDLAEGNNQHKVTAAQALTGTTTCTPINTMSSGGR